MHYRNKINFSKDNIARGLCTLVPFIVIADYAKSKINDIHVIRRCKYMMYAPKQTILSYIDYLSNGNNNNYYKLMKIFINEKCYIVAARKDPVQRNRQRA